MLELVGGGLTNRQIAAEMFLAEKTVKNYVSSLLAKLGFERRTQAAVFIAGPASPVPPGRPCRSQPPAQRPLADRPSPAVTRAEDAKPALTTQGWCRRPGR